MSDSITEFIVEREREVWQALLSGDATADRALLADDFLGVYPAGFAGPDEHAGLLDDGPTMSEYEIVAPRIRRFGSDLVLLAYEARYRTASGTESERMYVSSIWLRQGGRWVNVFSQDTPARPAD